MYLRNCWYVAAWNHELDDGPLARVLLNEPVVLYRDANGAPVALEDRCSHRFAPLSKGMVEGDCIRCGYHGLLFDRAGACVDVPGQSNVPLGSAIASYPTVEKYRWIWIWMGEASRADEALIPDYHWNDDPAWIAIGDRFYVKGDYRLLVDNLLDLSHVQYVHASTLGTEAVTEFPVEVEREADRVHVNRWIMKSPPPPMFEKAGGITGDVDRWQLISWTPPSHLVIDVGCATAGTGAREGNRTYGVTMFSNHSITPETETSCHYFWHHARDFELDRPEITDFLREAAGNAFFEDVAIIEAQQTSYDTAPPEFQQVDINADAGVLQARRVLDRLIAEEPKA